MMDPKPTKTPGRASGRPAAVAALVALLGGATVWARFADESAGRAPALEALARPRLCAGIALDGEILGLASGDSWEEVTAAAADLGLPPACAPLVPEVPDQGSLLGFVADADGGCRVIEAVSLPSPARILCGAGLSINRDAATDLQLLPGVGPVRSEALMESRERDGPFSSREDLQRVRGIGPVTAERMAPWLDDID